MLDVELQRQLRSLLPKPKKGRHSHWGVAVGAASVSIAATFTLVIYIGEIHKLPLNSVMTRLDTMLARCEGTHTSDIRQNISRRPGRRYPSFTMAEQIEAIEFRIDRLEAGNCFHDEKQAQLVNEIMLIRN